MFAWRLSVALVLLLLLAVPLAMALVEPLWQGQAWAVWQGGARLLPLLGNTAVLVVGTLAVALPLGTAGAVLLFRTDLPFRKTFRFLTVLALFIPLPVLVSAWQAALGTSGWLPIWEDRPGQPWTRGLGPAVWINSIASLPWVILLVGQGLCWVEGELEEDALLVVGPWRVLWHVTLPRCRAVIGAAAVWIGLQTAADITVTDMLEVRTFAEEVYYQFSAGEDNGLARAVAVALPLIGLTWLGLIWLVPRLERALPPLATMATPPRLFPLGRARWALLALTAAVVLVLAGIPLGSLIWKAGLHGRPLVWSAPFAWQSFSARFHLLGDKVALNLLLAALAGVVVTGLALITCWVAGEHRGFRLGLLTLLALAWALPGPIAGLGLKETIMHMVNGEAFFMPVRLDHDRLPSGPVSQLLYFGPSPVPVLWAHLLRFFPCAVALMWPALRMIPRELREAARLDGARPSQELSRIIAPLTGRVFAWSTVAVAALSLSEIAASKLVEPPGAFSETFTHLLFDRMHNGVDHEVASLCLVMLAETVVMAFVVAALARGWRRPRGAVKAARFAKNSVLAPGIEEREQSDFFSNS
jgi:iron(III) transport system permease protein